MKRIICFIIMFLFMLPLRAPQQSTTDY